MWSSKFFVVILLCTTVSGQEYGKCDKLLQLNQENTMVKDDIFRCFCGSRGFQSKICRAKVERIIKGLFPQDDGYQKGAIFGAGCAALASAVLYMFTWVLVSKLAQIKGIFSRKSKFLQRYPLGFYNPNYTEDDEADAEAMKCQMSVVVATLVEKTVNDAVSEVQQEIEDAKKKSTTDVVIDIKE